MNEAMKVLEEAFRQSPGIRFGVWWNVGLLAMSLAAMPFDRRRILGLNPWVKPVKFDVSVILFLLTIAVLLWALGDGWRVSKTWIGWGMGVAMVVEDTIIALQSVRGARSHMNFDTPLDGGLFAVMGVFIVVNTLLAVWLLGVWVRTDGGLPPAVVWGIRLGLVALLAGSSAGGRRVGHGAHTVGAADGGPGLALVNWSTRYGDLRVAHFFALHALQIFPLMGLALASTRLRASVQTVGVFGFAMVYLAAVWWLFQEAMRGVPVLRS
jgi:hypothetical protein